MKKNIVIALHVLFWILTLAVTFLPAITFEDALEIENWIIRAVVTKFFLAGFFYIFYFFLGPRILFRKKWLIFFALFIVSNLIYTYFVTWIVPLIYEFVLVAPRENPDWNSFYLTVFWFHFIYAVYGTLFRFTIDWFAGEDKRKEMEKQNMAAELALLRSQINPGFLFHSLNTINSFVKSDPDRSSAGIIRLSEIMRYMLNDANAELVPLSKEVSNIKNYIALQTLGECCTDRVNFSISGETDSVKVPPMLLMPFIENACRHCCPSETDFAINIELDVSGKGFRFRIVNFINMPGTTTTKETEACMKNINRRLNLTYGNDYELNTRISGDRFSAELLIGNSASVIALEAKEMQVD